MPKKYFKISLFIIVGLCVLIYGNSLSNDYGFDDEYVIVNNKKVSQGISGIPALFKSRYIESSTQNYGYRPITLSTFAIEYSLFGANATVSHFINLFLYILTCLLIFKILRSLFKNYHWLLPLFITVLFIVHPIHTEVVDNVKSRDEILAFLFALLALGSAIKYVRNLRLLWLVGVLGFMVLSFLSKLSALTFLAVIPLTVYFFENATKKVMLKLIGALFLPLIIFRLINTQLIETSGSRNLLFIENPLFVNGATFFEKIPMAFYSVFYYIKLLFVPHPLISYYGYDYVTIVGWENLYVWLGVIVLIPLFVFTIWKFRTKSVLAYGLVFFFVTISMYANLVKPAVGIIAERFAYIPSLGFCIVIGWFLLKLSRIDIGSKEENGFPKLKPVFLGIAGLLIIASSVKVFSRNQDWHDLVTLLERDLEIAPNSVKLNMLLANDLFKRVTTEKLEERQKDSLMKRSIYFYNKALSIYPKHTPAHNNLGVLYNLKGDIESSHEHFLKASQDENPEAKTYFNLGLSYRGMGDRKKAIENLKKSLEMDKGNYEVYYNLMNIQFEDDNFEDAMKTNLEMFRSFPENRSNTFSLGQKMAIAEFGSKTTYYIDLLLQKNLIAPQMYENFKKQLNSSFIEK
ncbi:tetratricopeptide repeat protein [Aequorivita sp. H23M31]|uniref:Tetratricopeptide repeat protein n=1 Tax=Aequorivita ciconiae TaxID=2494375 RepID=A0A410G4H5_9FLAO|nr:tetratricopeptide repeat protein [Aequorivita sp. H23M31]QAA82125.1 tetratricopeptide repeat protein [Aequorivita sp. H23M31]